MYIKHGSVTAARTPVLPVYTRILVQYIGYSLLGNSYKPPLFFTGIPISERITLTDQSS